MALTEPTVPVPVAELIALRDDVTNWESVAPLATVIARIPASPKVGDELTAIQVETLPHKAVVIDKDGDPWIVDKHGLAFFYNDDVPSIASAAYSPYALVYLPESK